MEIILPEENLPLPVQLRQEEFDSLRLLQKGTELDHMTEGIGLPEYKKVLDSFVASIVKRKALSALFGAEN